MKRIRLQIEHGEFSRHIGEELLLLTGQSFLLGSSFRYDQGMRRITFTLERFPFCGFERRLGVLRFPLYDRSRTVRTQVEVSDVDAIDAVWNDIGISSERFQIELGIVIRRGTLAVASVAEDRGKKLFSLVAKLQSLDIQVTDEGG